MPEVVSTVWSNVFMVAALQPGETLLVHGGGGGIGTAAIQLAKALGRPGRDHGRFGREGRRGRRRSGADLAINYREQDFVAELRRVRPRRCRRHPRQHRRASTSGATSNPLPCKGVWSSSGLQGGVKGELDLGLLMQRRAAP